MSIGPKFFYTRSLPCALWFFDKGKPEDLLDTVLMIDARNVYTVVSARSHVFTDEQLANLTAITWLYRGEHDKFVALLASYHQNLSKYLAELESRLTADGQQLTKLAKVLSDFAKVTADPAALAAVREKLGEEHGITDELLQSYRDEAQKPVAQAEAWQQVLDNAQAEANKLLMALVKLDDDCTFEQRKGLQAQAEATSLALKAGLVALEARHKAWLKLLEIAEKALRARQWSAFDGDAARDAKRALLSRDMKKREQPTIRDLGVEAFKRAIYFIGQAHWLLVRFPSGLYEDYPGLCRVVSREEISRTDFSLSPPRYVGVGQVETEDETVVLRMISELHTELSALQSDAKALETMLERLVAGVMA